MWETKHHAPVPPLDEVQMTRREGLRTLVGLVGGTFAGLSLAGCDRGGPGAGTSKNYLARITPNGSHSVFAVQSENGILLTSNAGGSIVLDSDIALGQDTPSKVLARITPNGSHSVYAVKWGEIEILTSNAGGLIVVGRDLPPPNGVPSDGLINDYSARSTPGGSHSVYEIIWRGRKYLTSNAGGLTEGGI
jgi:hypothetical protein